MFLNASQWRKRIRSETQLGHSGVSVGHAAVEIVMRVYEDLQSAKVLIIGSGEMAKMACQHFIAKQVGHITIAKS